MKENLKLSQKIKEIVESLSLRPQEISVAIIDLKGSEPQIAGFNTDHFIYPASIYKVFVAAEILRQIDVEERKLEDVVLISSLNEVDTNVRFFPKSTHKDYRPLLKKGETVTLDYLLDLMLTRSDNTAANILIDIADRQNINKHIIIPNGWEGSDVTRKFLDRLKEEGEYRVSKITVSNTRHLAELFYKIETNQLCSQWVSQKLKEYLLKWNRDKRGGLNLSVFKSYYRKGGWLEINGYKWNVYRGIKAVFQKGYAILRYNGDVGVVVGKNSHYSIAVLTLLKTKWPWQRFPMEELSRKIYEIMETN
ncbi:MAG: serine hydrolase [Candidatus Zambryskibacteria bacterium]|nr:serine hydrolase [Candidatus Zambryskibacteria bacterium]